MSPAEETPRARVVQLESDMANLASFLTFANDGREESFPYIVQENRRKLRAACAEYLDMTAQLGTAETEQELEPVKLGPGSNP